MHFLILAITNKYTTYTIVCIKNKKCSIKSFNLFQNLTLYESDVRFARFAYFRNGP